MVIDLKALKSMRVIDFRPMNITDSYNIILTQYPARFYQSYARMKNDLVTPSDIEDFKLKSASIHAECMTIDNYGLTAYIPVGIELKV